MNLSTRHRMARQFAGILLVGFIVCAAIRLAVPQTPAVYAAPPRDDKETPGEHTKRTAELREALAGMFDIYFDVAQVESDKPLIANARFVDLVDVTGKELLRIVDTKNHQWLIDPDTVLTYRIRAKTAGKAQ